MRKRILENKKETSLKEYQLVKEWAKKITSLENELYEMDEEMEDFDEIYSSKKAELNKEIECYNNYRLSVTYLLYSVADLIQQMWYDDEGEEYYSYKEWWEKGYELEHSMYFTQW